MLTQRAVHVEFRNRLGAAVKEIVVAEARVAGGSEVCDRAAQEATGGGNGGGGSAGGGGSGEPCITGAQYDPAKNLCIITRERDGNLANGRETIAVVGRTRARAAGAWRRPARRRSPCA